ncbi:hypothetical protein [Brevibacillus thermoruber]|uniref:hypothetical protein n=1 Tax=Brevibacillus thermoruber TaxID=33942 RepID=UPI00126801EF|nr:hypothetical protein [Brevibacillus thermoruber]
MRTSSNVMGIQGKLMLERIAATLDAVQAGHQQKPAYLLADRKIQMDKPETDEGERQPEVVFAARDVVYLDERLTREIPEPNWSKAAPAGCVIPDKAGAAAGFRAYGGHSGAAGMCTCVQAAGGWTQQAERLQAADRWAVPSGGSVLVHAGSGDMGNAPQDVRSAPAPPEG